MTLELPAEDRRGDGGEYDCVRCGACCFSEHAGYIVVYEIDWDRMTPQARRFVEPAPAGISGTAGSRRSMRMERGRCAALALRPEGSLYPCQIYEERPDACRALVPGWSDCRAQRGEKQLVAVEALRRRVSGEEPDQ